MTRDDTLRRLLREGRLTHEGRLEVSNRWFACERSLEAKEKRICELEADLSDMAAVARQECWQDASTGKQLILRSAEKALESRDE